MDLNTEKKPYQPLIPWHQQQPAKCYHASQTKSKWRTHKLFNELMNNAYMVLLVRVKKLYAGSNVKVHERNHRSDRSFNHTTMHVMLSKEFHLEIECDCVHHKCFILFAFENCKHEAAIRKWLREYPFSVSHKEQRPVGGVTAYFNRVLAFQGESYFYHL